MSEIEKLCARNCGSRYWNNQDWYKLEISAQEIQKELLLFENCLHINMETENIVQKYDIDKQLYIYEKKGTIHLEKYKQILENFLDEISTLIIKEDFPSIQEKEIFLYHCGAKLLFQMLIKNLQDKNLGLCFYHIKGSINFTSQFSKNYIKIVFINWFNQKFIEINTKKVNSYWLYKQQMRHLHHLCENLYEKESQQKILPVYETEKNKWLWGILSDILGERRAEILKRFQVKINNPYSLV